MTDSVTNQDELEPTEGDVPAADDALEDETTVDDVPEEEGVEAQDADELGDEAPVIEEPALDEAPDAGLGDDEALDVGGLEEDPLAALQEDYDGLNDRHLRLAAEFNNFRKRTEAERLHMWGRAQAEIVSRLVDVLDDLQRVAALDLENATVEGIMEGIDLVERKFVRALDDAGAEVIDPVGEAFDPEIMEAMMRVPAESEEDDDTVAQVFQKGYTFKGHLVRAARVSVLKHG